MMKHKVSNRMLFRRTLCAVLVILTLLRGNTFPQVARAGPGVNAAAQLPDWTIQPTPITEGYLSDICFLDENTGWAVGYDDATEQAAIIHTTNGGEEWVAQPNPLVGPLNGVFFVDGSTGYAVGQNWEDARIAILKTTNGGQEWQEQTLPAIHGMLEDVLLVSATEGWAVGINLDDWETLILHTEDGTTWDESSHPVHAGTLSALSFPDSTHGWAVGVDEDSETPIILRTSDGGENWVEQAHPIASGQLADVFFYNTDVGWAVGTLGEAALVLHTTDGGATWTALGLPQAPLNTGASSEARSSGAANSQASITKMTALYFITLYWGLVACILPASGSPATWSQTTEGVNQEFSSTLCQTTNGGATWTVAVNPLLNALIWNIEIVGGQVYAVGSQGSGAVVGKVGVTPPQLTEIVVNPAAADLEIGQQQQFTATGKDSFGNEFPITPNWSASGGDITQGGLYTAEQTGYHTITARMGTIVGTATVRVTPQLTEIVVNPAAADLEIGQQQQFTATGKDSFGNEFSITPNWDATGGTITQGGLYTAEQTGYHTITARVGTIVGTATVHVTSPELASIDVDPASANLEVGQQIIFTATGKDGQGNVIPITPIWSTDGGTITDGGLYTGTKVGVFIVTASVPGSMIVGTATVHVTSPELASIDVDPASANLEVGQQIIFTATGKDGQGNVIPITPIWSASGGKVATGGARIAAADAQRALYTAGNLPGHYGVVAAVGEIEGHAQVEIRGDPPPNLAPGESYEHTFPTAGTYPYYNRYNPRLGGTVEVSPTVGQVVGQVVTLSYTTVPISITEAGFDPLTVTIGLGDTVRWTNNGTATHAIHGGAPYQAYLPLVLK